MILIGYIIVVLLKLEINLIWISGTNFAYLLKLCLLKDIHLTFSDKDTFFSLCLEFYISPTARVTERPDFSASLTKQTDQTQNPSIQSMQLYHYTREICEYYKGQTCRPVVQFVNFTGEHLGNYYVCKHVRTLLVLLVYFFFCFFLFCIIN